MRRTPILFAAGLSLAGCATVGPVTGRQMQIVAEAAQAPPAALRARAENGEANAQLASSLVLENDLAGCRATCRRPLWTARSR